MLRINNKIKSFSILLNSLTVIYNFVWKRKNVSKIDLYIREIELSIFMQLC